jgi:AraC-like DNA-binding protein
MTAMWTRECRRVGNFRLRREAARMTHQSDGLHGLRVRSYASAAFVVAETRYDANVLLPNHVHETPYVSVLLGGTYTEVCEAETGFYEGLVAIYHPAGEVHADHFGAAGRCVNVVLTSAAEARLADLGFATDRRSRVRGRVAAAFVATLEEPHQQNARYADDLLVELAAAHAACEHRGTQWFSEALRLLAADLDEHRSIAEIAAGVGVHPTSLARECRLRIGMSPREYRRQHAFQRAAALLTRTTIGTAEIAQATGFTDQSHLVRAFRAWAGMTPGLFRRRFGTVRR